MYKFVRTFKKNSSKNIENDQESNTNNNYQCDLGNKKPSDNHNQQVNFPDFETVEEPEFNNNESSNTAHSSQSYLQNETITPYEQIKSSLESRKHLYF